MAKLTYTLTRDTVFKIVFMKNLDFLKHLVAELLAIPLAEIKDFTASIREVPPQGIGSKHCRIDISMTVNGQRVNLEIQVRDEKDYAERALFIGSLDFAHALKKGKAYLEVPKVIVISILAFSLFECDEYKSEFMLLERTRHTLMTDKAAYYFYELPKLPKSYDTNSELDLWLALFKAKTEKDLAKLKALEVPFVQNVIEAYTHAIATDEFRQLEMAREIAEHDEASALYNAERKGIEKGIKKGIKKGREEERRKWNSALAQKDAELAAMKAEMAKLKAKQR